MRSGHSFPVRAQRRLLQDRLPLEAHLRRRTSRTPEPNRLFYALGYFTEPATLRGTIFLVHEPVDQVAEQRSAWIYNSGARRVRRAPDLDYDGVNDGSEGMLVTDQVDAYNGAPDRYRLEARRQARDLRPVQLYKLSDKSLKYKDIIGTHTINSDLVRYELHRVWVVEGDAQAGRSATSTRKRTFYLDEDSWSVLSEDAYDTRGGLWRVALHGLMQCYDAQVPWYRFGIYHDLNNGGYLVGRPRQRDQDADRVRREGQARRLPAGRAAAPRRHAVSGLWAVGDGR